MIEPGEAETLKKYFKAIHDWYEGESYSISGIKELGDISALETGIFDQSEHFLSVKGYQHSFGCSGDSFRGGAYFEIAPGLYIATEFWV